VSTISDPDNEDYIQPSSGARTGTSTNTHRWDSFDYLQHWYAVSWVDDIIPNRPEKITLFDVDYAVVVTKNSDQKNTIDTTTTVMAFIDQCPHRKAALSEGRVTNNGKYLQCAYHGWSFASNGTCVDIPQSEIATTTSTTTSGRTKRYSPKSCATAIPARIHQELIWLWPGPTRPNDTYPDPPTIPEMDHQSNTSQSFQITKTVRDFPMIDYSLLLSNILDPDHGIFAHQSKPFDMYMGSSHYPLTVRQEFPYNGTGWILQSQVPAVSKLLVPPTTTYNHKEDNKKGAKSKINKKHNNLPSDSSIVATSTFWAPTTVALCRRNVHNETNFVTAFWVVPTGVGKSRFLSAGIGKIPFRIPRWIQHITLNAFLDQDSVLVASQQSPVLQEEVRQIQSALASSLSSSSSSSNNHHNQPHPKSSSSLLEPLRMTARQKLFCYQSPTDKMVAVLDQFWDATLARAPNRIQGLLTMAQRGDLQHSTLDRRIVLDREVQHLNICPDSQGFVRKCQQIQYLTWTMVGIWIVFRQQLPSRFQSWVWPLMSTLVGFVTRRLRQCFYYTYTKDKNFQKLSTIPNLWKDPN
jgi:nitrite reductase/ring-hydroxylating ferredoxin subunit